jgi:hypothetical protein
VIADIAATFPSAPPVTFTVDQATGALDFHIGAVVVRGSIMPMPMPDDHLEPAYRLSWLWPNAKEELRGHASMLILSSAGGDTAVERLVAQTMVAAAVIGTCPQAVGVLWDAANHLIKGKVFRDFASQRLPNLPLLLWVGMAAGPNADGTSRGYTVGMGQFGLLDVETHDAPLDIAGLRQRFSNLAGHLIAKSPDIKDGATISQSETHKVTVSYGESGFGLEGRVMRLHHLAKS